MTEDDRPPGAAERLRAITFLAPGIPLEFFEIVTDHLARTLSCEIELKMESRSSGPMHGDSDPFAEGKADIGFLCSPSYLYLRALESPSVELVPAGFVFRDSRNDREPVYFSEVVVRTDHPATKFGDLAGSAWGFNDECSLSGYFAALQKLSELGCTKSFFRSRTRTGSHHSSIEAILRGDIDAASIDSTVLATLRHDRPELASSLRVLDSWGPFPIQPVVVRSELGSEYATHIADALLALPQASEHARRLSSLGFDGCVPIDDSAYAEERRVLSDMGSLPPLP